MINSGKKRNQNKFAVHSILQDNYYILLYLRQKWTFSVRLLTADCKNVNTARRLSLLNKLT